MKLGPNEVYRSPGRSVDVSFFSQNSVQRSGFVLQYESGKTFLNTIVHEYCQVHDCMNSFRIFDQVTDCPSKVSHSEYA